MHTARSTAARPAFQSRLARLPESTRVGLVCGLAAFVLYAATCSRTVQWQDSGVHQYRIIFGQLENPLGLALSHPLHYWLGRMFLWLPVGEAPFRLTLLSAFCGAIGVGALGSVVTTLTRSTFAAIFAAATLAFAHIYWQMSALTETYTLAAALMTCEWLLLLQYARTREPLWLMAVFAVNGLHVAGHMLGVLTLVTYAALIVERVVRKRMPPVWLVAAAVAWLLGALPYWTLVLAHLSRTGDLGGTLYSAFFGVGIGGGGYASQVLNASLSWGLVGKALLYWGYNFPTLAIGLAIFGLMGSVRGRLRIVRLLLIAQSAIILLFVSRYTIGDQLTFYVPVCVVTALWAGVGVARLRQTPDLGRPRRWVTPLLVTNALLPLLVYQAFPALARHRGWLSGQMGAAPFRDPYAYFLQPWKAGDDSGARFAQAALQAAGRGGWFLAELNTGHMTACYYRVRVQGSGFGVQDPHSVPLTRVFSHRDDLTEPGGYLTDDDLREHLEENGTVVAAPFDAIEEWWGEDFEVRRGDLFWRIALAEPP